MNILITGATGFLGSALTRHWIEAGYRVTALTRRDSVLRRIAALQPRLEVVDCLVDADISDVVQRVAPDLIVHTACSYGRQGETMLELFDANVRLGMLLLNSALQDREKPINFINTGTVLSPDVSAYALSKSQFSQWGQLLAVQHPARIRFVNVLLQHMYGADDSPGKFTTHVLRTCLKHDPELLLTAGEQRRDFIYIDDVVSAFTVVVENIEQFSGYEDLQLGSGEAPPLSSFVLAVHQLTQSRTRLRFGALPYRPNEAMDCKADLKRLHGMGWSPKFNLEDGIRRTIELELEINS